MIRAIVYGTLILSLFFYVSCSSEEATVEEEVYVKLLAELAILNAMSDLYMGDTDYEIRREEILSEYNISEEQFRKSHDIYQQQIPEQLDRLQQVNIMLRQERDSIQQAERDFRRANRESADSLRQRIINGEVNSDTTNN